MEHEGIARIKTFLTKHGSSYEGLSESKKRQFQSVDNAIQTRLQSIVAAETTIREQMINVQNIAADTGLARKTFYNNDLLRLYVEEYAFEAFGSFTKMKEECKRLKEEITQLKNERQKMVDRDREIELTRLEIAALQTEILLLREEKDALNQELSSLKNSKSPKKIDKILIPKNGDFASFFGKH